MIRRSHNRRHLGFHVALLTLVTAATTACVTVRPVIVDRKTALENEILGRFQRLQRELRLLTADPRELSELPPAQRRVLQAMLDRELLRPRLALHKENKAVGESKDGLLRVLAAPENPTAASELRALVAWENDSRMRIMQGVIAASDRLHPADLPEVRRMFHRLHVELARDGDRVQRADGSWQTVSRQ